MGVVTASGDGVVEVVVDMWGRGCHYQWFRCQSGVWKHNENGTWKWWDNRVVHSSHFRLLFGYFCFTFWLLFQKWYLKMTWKWRRKGAFLKNGPIPPILQRASFLCSFLSSLFVILSNSAPTPNPLHHHQRRRLTPLPPQLRHLPSPLPRPLPHRLSPPTTANQPHRAQTTTKVVWALGNLFFLSSFLFFLTN